MSLQEGPEDAASLALLHGEALLRACAAVKAWHGAGRRVLVHCSAGLSRSASIVIGLLMELNKVSIKDAAEAVAAARGRRLLVRSPFWTSLARCEQRAVGGGQREQGPPLAPSLDLAPWFCEDFEAFPADLVRRLVAEKGGDAGAVFAALNSALPGVLGRGVPLAARAGKAMCAVCKDFAPTAVEMDMGFTGVRGDGLHCSQCFWERAGLAPELQAVKGAFQAAGNWPPKMPRRGGAAAGVGGAGAAGGGAP